MGQEAKIDLQREQARAWQRQEVKRRIAEIDAGTGDHGEVSEEEDEGVFDRWLAKPDQDIRSAP
ncbi:MAG: hypothetical protein ABR573_07050 [Candidatus Dormibacteria bacterium]